MILFFYAIPAAFLAYMLPQQQSVFWIEDANIKLIPLHMHFASDPTRGQAVVGGIDFDATVQIHAPLAMLVVAKRFQGKRQQGWFFFGKHGGDLSFRGAMNAGIGTAGLPTIQIGLGLLQALKAFSLERSLGVADAGFHFSFSIGILEKEKWNPASATPNERSRENALRAWRRPKPIWIVGRPAVPIPAFMAPRNDKSPPCLPKKNQPCCRFPWNLFATTSMASGA